MQRATFLLMINEPMLRCGQSYSQLIHTLTLLGYQSSLGEARGNEVKVRSEIPIQIQDLSQERFCDIYHRRSRASSTTAS